jgi:hypothetical protein
MADPINNIPNRDNKRNAIIELKSGVSLYYVEQAMWFAVLGRAILDIGMRDSNKKYIKHRENSDVYFRQRSMMEHVLDGAGVSRGYMLRVLQKHDVWPLPAEYYAI